MSERERWVVYPLLFLALGAALRDKLFDRTITKSIVCQELMVLDEAGIMAQIGRSDSMRASSNAYMVVNGQLDTDLINSKQYAFRNVPFWPVLQTIMSPHIDLLRSRQQSKGTTPPGTNVTPPQPPQSAADQAGNPTDELKPGDGQPQAPGKPDSSSEPATEAPLADPAENQ
jgi:hypothetical protein